VFLWNLLIAILWGSLLRDMRPLNLAVGFLLGFAVLGWMRSAIGKPRYAQRVLNVVRLLGLLSWELTISNLRVALDVITPRHRSRPAIVAYPLDASTDAEITLFACTLSFMPGTISVDLSPDRSVLFVHVMFFDDRDSFCERLRERVERPLLEVLRG
jgi:multicomponent Na+:H+ antiporter subunit E